MWTGVGVISTVLPAMAVALAIRVGLIWPKSPGRFGPLAQTFLMYVGFVIPPATAITLVAWYRTRDQMRPGCCPLCGYDRSGLPTAAPCPECGHART
jgi:hypothetical protein